MTRRDPHWLGIDNGSTVTKAAVFDAEGRELAVVARRVAIQSPHVDQVERDPEQSWRDTADCIREAILQARLPPEAIAAVGCTGYGNGLHLLDAAGEAVRPFIGSGDTRAREWVGLQTACEAAAAILPHTAQSLWAGQPPALLTWLRDHEPGPLAAARHAVAMKDVTRIALVGEIAAEITDASATSMMSVVERRYEPAVLESLGLGGCQRLLPPLVESTAIAGQVQRAAASATGLAAGTPVAGGLFDIDACLLAAGITDDAAIGVAAGTWGNTLSFATRPVTDGSLFMTSCGPEPGSFVLLEGSPTSAGTLDWFTRTFLPELSVDAGGAGPSRIDAVVASIEPGDRDPFFLPFVTGSFGGGRAGGGFLGLESHHTRAHCLRAVLEGIAFAHVWHMQRLLSHRPAAKVVRLTGGIGRLESWAQLFADALGLPVEVPAGRELGALGAAILAAAAAGHGPLPAAAARMTRIDRVYEPAASRGPLLQERYARFTHAIAALDHLS
ncbi:MAG: FGGY-family carbohydrate kinase [Planctomycetia bacterium]